MNEITYQTQQLHLQYIAILTTLDYGIFMEGYRKLFWGNFLQPVLPAGCPLFELVRISDKLKFCPTLILRRYI